MGVGVAPSRGTSKKRHPLFDAALDDGTSTRGLRHPYHRETRPPSIGRPALRVVSALAVVSASVDWVYQGRNGLPASKGS